MQGGDLSNGSVKYLYLNDKIGLTKANTEAANFRFYLKPNCQAAETVTVVGNASLYRFQLKSGRRSLKVCPFRATVVVQHDDLVEKDPNPVDIKGSI